MDKWWQHYRGGLEVIKPLGLKWFRGIVLAIALWMALTQSVVRMAPAQAQKGIVGGDEAFLNINMAIDGAFTLDYSQQLQGDPSPATLKEIGRNLESIGPSCHPTWGDPYRYQGGIGHYLTCDRFPSASGLRSQAKFNLQPLLDSLQSSQTPTLTISIAFPPNLPVYQIPPQFQRQQDWYGYEQTVYQLSIDVDRPESGTIAIEYGYQLSDVAKMLLPLGAIGLLAPLLIGVGRWWVLQRGHPELKAAGFQFQQLRGYLQLLVWGSWIGCLFGLHWGSLFQLVTADWGIVPQTFGMFVGMTAVPAGICLLCEWIAYPVTEQLGRVKPTFKKVMSIALLTQAVFAEALTIGPALNAIFSGHYRVGILWLIGAIAVAFWLKQVQMKVLDFVPQAVTVGELRDRVFELAEAANTTIQQLYVLPTRKTQVANAFAVKGGIVMLTDYLLENLSKREVDAVIAHELAHFQHKHHAIRQFLLVGVSIGIYLLISWGDRFATSFPLAILACIVGISIYLHQSRRHEHQADLGAAQLTGDPEAMISALVAITHLAEMPAHWNLFVEALGTHPSLKNRAQAIASAHNIHPGRVEQLLRRSQLDKDAYAIASEEETDRAVFSTSFKTRIGIQILMALVATATIVPAATVAVAPLLPRSLQTSTLAICPLMTFILLLALDNWAPQWGMEKLKQRLGKKLQQQGIEETSQGYFVGFSPSFEPKLYEGHLFWDIGFLKLQRGQLSYAGDRTQFVVPLTAIEHLGSVRPRLEWFRPELIQLQWKNSEREIFSGYFSIREERSSLQLRKDNRNLAKLLEQWKDGKGPEFPIQLLAGQSEWQLGPVTSAPVEELRKNVWLVWGQLMIASVGISFLLGFTVLEGLYVWGVSSGTFTLLLLPILLYREKV